jgi:hypothetical protein
MKIVKAFLDTVVGYVSNLHCKTSPMETSPFQLKMYPNLARELVDKQTWHYLRLPNGTLQIPLKDAIEYLAEINDKKSIERLRSLLYFYGKPKEPGKSNQLFKGILTSEYNVITIQESAAKALLKLMSEEEAFALAAKIITGSADPHLNSGVIKLFNDFLEEILSNKHPNQKPPRYARR